MKIVSQVPNAMPAVTNKLTPVASGTSDFQIAFATAIKTPTVAGKVSDSKLVKLQGDETKKASTSDGKKKSSPASDADESVIAHTATDSSELIPVPSVPQSEGLTAVVDQTSAKVLLSGAVPAVTVAGNSDAAEFDKISGHPAAAAAEVADIAAKSSDKSVLGDTQAKLLPGHTAAPSAIAASTTPSKASDVATNRISSGVEGEPPSKGLPIAKFDSQSERSVTDAAVPAVLPTSVTPPQDVSPRSPVQDTNAAPAVSKAPDFKVAPAKSDGLALPGTSPAKGKSALARTYGVADEKEAATGADSDSVKARPETSPVTSKEDPGGTVDLAQSSAMAQSIRAPQGSGPADSPQSPQVGPQGSSVNVHAPTFSASASDVGTQAAHAMSSAQFIQSAHGSEMRLGMQSAEFGNISINTSLDRQALSAQISIDHTALGHALAAHLPAIQEKLGSAYGIQARVELRDTGNNSSLNDSSNRESKGSRQAQTGQSGPAGASAASLPSSIGAVTSSAYTSMSASTSRLDIRI